MESSSLLAKGSRLTPCARRASSRPPLTIDVAVLGDAASAPAVFLHTSGTHGVEGFAGSAIQVAYLRSGRPPPANVALVLVHGVNAHGFAEGRRWTERGVDLNRNFIGPRQGGTIDGTSTPLTFDSLADLPYELYYTASPIVNLQRPPPLGCCGAVEASLASLTSRLSLA